jgi:cytochrome bd-type quinol oxidase subunit 2
MSMRRSYGRSGSLWRRWPTLPGSLSPYLVPRVTALESEADSLTLVFMMLGIGMLIPVMIAYNAYQYAVFCVTATAL